MRISSFALLLGIISVAAFGQMFPDSTFIVKIEHVKIDLPQSTSSTCLAVFPDGRFHMEQTSFWPNSGTRILEDSLSAVQLNALSATLESHELKALTVTENQQFEIKQGEIVRGVIPRGDGTQKFVVSGVEAPRAQRPKQLPSALNPLIRWLEATTKSINHSKVRALKTKPVNCWLRD